MTGLALEVGVIMIVRHQCGGDDFDKSVLPVFGGTVGLRAPYKSRWSSGDDASL